VRASKKAKQSKLVLIKDSGHLLHEEKSQLVVKEIKSFYENIK
jgi:pimeloyl-ACP methyl ester carboxylesterase